jgi:prevent-host-death family protein
VRSVQVREAKATLSALIEAAERGEPTMITRHGRPAAIVAPVEVADQFRERLRPSFAELLLAFPGGLEFERDQTPLRDIDL